jgi:hypothetical protein
MSRHDSTRVGRARSWVTEMKNAPTREYVIIRIYQYLDIDYRRL